MTENNGPYTGKGVVIGIVDNGFQYDHVDFLNADKSDTRIKRVWDQHGTGNAPEGFGYGAEYKTTAEIRAAKYDLTSGFHATHVSGIASGSDKSTPYYGVAPDADLVFVSFKSTNAQIVDGIKYVFDYAKSVGKPAVVNISLGSHMVLTTEAPTPISRLPTWLVRAASSLVPQATKVLTNCTPARPLPPPTSK